ncbi:MAG TPA: PASTA domain-containing protein, partial [Candidatus Hydrogenedentes bacterium]|nr:PASTA domain-containing protein [Candidatus Hydrogenedentota bacterium]
DADTMAEHDATPPTEDALPLDALLTPLDGVSFVALQTPGTSVTNTMPNLIGLTKKQAREQLQRINLPMDARGAGRVVAQDPPPGTDLTNVSLCILTFSNTGEWLPIADLAPIDPTDTSARAKEERETS